MTFSDLTPKDAKLIRLGLGVDIHNNQMELVALHGMKQLLEAGKGGKKITKRFFDAYKEAMAVHIMVKPGVCAHIFATLGDSAARKITIHVQMAQYLDEENFRREVIGNEPVKMKTSFTNLAMDDEATDIPKLLASIEERITIAEKSSVSAVDALARLDTWIAAHNAAAAQIRAILASIEPINYNVSTRADLTRARF